MKRVSDRGSGISWRGSSRAAIVPLVCVWLVALSCDPENGWNTNPTPASDFVLKDLNPNSPSFGQKRRLLQTRKVVVLYFASYT